MSRKKFIESLGATCDNWTWSWSFVNHADQFVVFGAWDIREYGHRQLILDTEWETKKNGARQPGYRQSVEHLRLVEQDNYTLKTFKMYYEEGNPETGTAKIKGFERQVTDRVLVREGAKWFATPSGVDPALSEEVGRTDEIFLEGALQTSSGLKPERNARAREKCIDKHGLSCVVCGFDFQRMYGSHGEGFIHVHHLFPLSSLSGPREVNPETDLRPVCPNCHAMLHRGKRDDILSIEELKAILSDGPYS